jgi:hypothetical protein
MHEEFTAIAQGRSDYIVEVIGTKAVDSDVVMTILATEEAIYITKEQAMKFFGLVEKQQ